MRPDGSLLHILICHTCSVVSVEETYRGMVKNPWENKSNPLIIHPLVESRMHDVVHHPVIYFFETISLIKMMECMQEKLPL
jgi:hypothetical protein